ncbi:MAG: hypothetical protein HY905_22485 [Deltaproteobacteria bacterium]|nr:hypothetical protein [Deltaproteobacteria bacterium]
MVRDTATVYDSVRAVTVLFDGANVWEYDGTNWAHANPAETPPVRDLHAMAYDPDRARVILVGGSGYVSDTYTAFQDHWEYDGSTWIQRHGVTGLPQTDRSPMVYDSARDRTVLFGGGVPCGDGPCEETLADTWEYAAR